MKISVLLLSVLTWSAGGDPEVARILDRVKAARPTDADLAFYSLDWASSLKEAKARAAKENRPIFFVAVTNISGPDDFYTGHC